MKKKTVIIILIEILILLGIILIVNMDFIKWIPKCYIYESTGILCPACGSTRSIISLINLDIISALKYHFVLVITILYLLICNVIYLINLNKEKKIATWIYPKYWYAIIFAIILVIYMILRNLL